MSCRAPRLASHAQLDREIAAGGWYIVKQLANSSVVFDWPHEHMYARLRAEADLMLFDADDYLAWVNKRAIRSPSSGSADRNGAC